MKHFQLKPVALATAAFLYASASFQVAIAEDTEIYVPKDIPADQQVRPNILLVLDTSGSMSTTVTGTSPKKSRIEVLREVVHDLVGTLKNQNVNLGFMRFHGSDGGAVTKAVEHLTADNAAAFLQKIDDTIKDGGNTPMSETYYESYLYLAGKQPYWGKYGTNQRNGTDRNALTNATKNGTCSTADNCQWVYKSPITHSCQKTHIVYITDGAPVSDNSSNTSIRNLLEKTSPQGNQTNPVWKKSTCNSGNGECLPHLAEYMYNQDIAAENGLPKGFDDPTGRKQNITSHFIGFALDLALLKNAADAGGGKYYTSNNVSGLVDALQSIIVDITADNTTFVAPSVAVTAYNNFGFRDELYYALFRPSEGSNWPGNVKKYKLKSTDADGKPVTPLIVDRNGTHAIDQTTGFFKETSSSFWNTVVDGEDVSKGGFAARLQPGTRKIYTWYGTDKKAGNPGAAETLKVFSSNGTLNTTTTNTSNISNTMLGVNSSGDRTKVLRWIRGYQEDSDSAARYAIGDILHNEPRLIAYKTDENIERAEGENSKEEVVIFVGTNEGFIHAIDANTGDEKFAFLPKELLSVPNKYRQNNVGYNNKAYGMDGYFTALTEYGSRLSDDTRVASKVNLYAGMRRGGSNYYALDVKDLSTPQLKWVLKGAYKDNYRDLINQNSDDIYRPGGANSETTSGFERLGLTFSAAKIGKLKVGGTTKDVLVFAGGYDAKHDVVGNNVPRNDEVGNAIYIVDADSGELLWRASGNNGRTQSSLANSMQLASMTNSMPASPTIIDINGDGLIDIIYATDLRGQIFRFDITSGNVNSINGHLFAQLGGADATNNRRFFNSPDVALIRDRGQKPYFTISVGSGFRESPLNEQTDDRFYMIRDTYVTQSRSSLATPPVITESDLTDVSGLDSSAANTEAAYARIAEHQSKIDALEAAVRQKEQEFEDHKNSIGYTAEHNAYLDAMTAANDLQRDIDGIILSAYPAFDPENYTEDGYYNSNYFANHVDEAAQQANYQKAIAGLQAAINKLETDGNVPDAKLLAQHYELLLASQQIQQNSAKELLKKENLVLYGHANPELTPELIAEIESQFGNPGIAYENYGDFSDLAELELDSRIATSYEAHLIKPEVLFRKNLIENNLAGLLTALDADPLDLTDITSNLPTILTGTEPEPDLVNLLEKNQETILDELQATADNFSNKASDMQEKADQLVAVQGTANTHKAAADALETGFQPYLDAIEAAYEATRDPNTGIYAWRVKINDEYKSLDLDGDTMSDEQKAHLLNSDGFMLRLPRGEKVLADSISYSGTVLFSTFSPRGENISDCGSDVGVGRTYGLSLRTAEGVFTTEIGGDTKYVRSMVNKQAGIPPTPVILVTPEGTEGGLHDGIYTTPNDSPINPTYWREEE